jgi:hypothetical protein
VEGCELYDVELLCKNSPRAESEEDDTRGISVSVRGDHPAARGRTRLYRIELMGRMALFLSVRMAAENGSHSARIEAFSWPEAYHATQEEIAQRLVGFS